MKYTTYLIILLCMLGCRSELEEEYGGNLSYIHIWCDSCQAEHVGTYFKESGFSFYCGSEIIYESKDWDEDKYIDWMLRHYGEQEVLLLDTRYNDWKVVLL